ncbi:MAG: winged helix-turn-helix domain-containing protein [Candidatus Bathyarchaeia archaeon]
MILTTLEEKTLTAQDLVNSTRLSRGKISYHLKLLEKNKLVRRNPTAKRGAFWEHTGLGQQSMKDSKY